MTTVAGESGSTGNDCDCSGSPAVKFKGPLGLALTPDENNLYILESDTSGKGGMRKLSTS